MKASELRIGNYVNFKNREDIFFCEVITLDKCGYIHLQRIFKDNLHNDDQPESIEDITPIPLTEDWLLKFGFVSNPYQDRYENEFIHVECNKTRGITELWIERMPHIKYVHQLQNLYFALTGEELLAS
jgi:hypothetical protein